MTFPNLVDDDDDDYDPDDDDDDDGRFFSLETLPHRQCMCLV